jgi:gliding motility-associated protein GldM
MAGGKLTPRQKMINLMYLVFIAMLALNMSKEVLSAFGLMNEKFESANKSAISNNEDLLSFLIQKGTENPGEFGKAKEVAVKVNQISKDFYSYVETLKLDATNGVELDDKTGKLPYESMEKGPHIDETWFKGDGYSNKGNEIVSKINKYISDINAVTSGQKDVKGVIKEIELKFSTADVKNKDGKFIKYLNYHFEHYPAIASLTKLSSWQNDITKTETDIYNALLGKAAQDAASYNKFVGIVVLDKNVYYQGEKVTGKVVLGKYDEDTKPTSFSGPGKLVNGQAIISETAGGVGERIIDGSFVFTETGAPIKVPFRGKYVVVPRPNSATIAADKMNVVYRGVPNPISISFAGVAADKISASAPGLKSIGGGKYLMIPGAGKEAIINVTGTLADGSKVSDKKVFRIKSLPKAVGLFRDEEESVSGSKGSLEISPLGARFTPDFDYDLPLEVTGFVFRVPGQLDIKVNGNKLDAACKAALVKVGKGTVVRFLKIQTKVKGSSGGESTASSVSYEIK